MTHNQTEALDTAVYKNILGDLINWVYMNAKWDALPVPVARALTLHRALEKSELRDLQTLVDAKSVIEQCRAALAEELSAWDIDPPIAHVNDSYNACDEWLNNLDPDSFPASLEIGEVSAATALHEAVSAIYFDDSSKFKPALFAIVLALDPDLIQDVDIRPKAAFDKTLARLTQLRDLQG